MSIGLRRFVLPAAVLMAVAAGQTVVAEPATVPARATPLTATPVSTGDRAVFVPMAQRRLLDTRSGSAVSPSAPRAVQVTGVAGIPVDALAVVVNVAAYQPAKAGYLTVYPTGSSRPVARSVSFAAREIAENVLTVKLGSGGRISVFASTVSHVVADVAGYYRNHAHDDRYLLKGEAQGRTAANALSCPAGSLIRAVAADGAPTCVQDASGPVESVGAGLLLTDGVLSAQQSRTAVNAFTCPPGHYLRAVAADGAPTCAADVDTDTDTDTDTTYQAGFGLLLDGTLLSAEQGRSAKNAFTCEEGFLLRAVAEDGTPTCDEDRFGPTYAAGFGIGIDGGTISAHQARTAPNAFACPAGQALRTVGADGAPTCAVLPTYTAGPGLVLNGTAFSSAYGPTVVPVRGDATPTENGTLLRNTMAAVTGASQEKPYVLALAPGTYELGGTPLTMKPYVSVVGAGRGFTTITGARVSQSGGLVNLGDQTTLAGVTVRNMVNSGTSFVTAIMSNGAVAARLFDVHGYASQAGGETYGLLAFAGGSISVESSQFTAINPTAIGTGIYSIANTVVRARNVEVGHSAAGGWALHAYNNSRIEFADGYANGPVRNGTPDSTVQVSHSRVDGPITGGVQCFGVHTSAMTAATCA